MPSPTEPSQMLGRNEVYLNLVPKQMSPKVCKERRAQLNFSNFPSEVWASKILQQNNLHGFRRNVCIDSRYFGDFVWRRFKVVLEIDGKSHDGKEEYDNQRDNHLRSLGYKVFRVKHHDLNSLNYLIPKIKELITPKSGDFTYRPKQKLNLNEDNQKLLKVSLKQRKKSKVKGNIRLQKKVRGAIAFARTLMPRAADMFLTNKLKELGLTPQEAKAILYARS